MVSERASRSGRDLMQSIIDLIRFDDIRTRNELAERTGMSRTVITQRVAELIDLGVVIEDSSVASTGGRTPKAIRLHNNAGRVIGIELGGTAIASGGTDLAGNLVTERYSPWRMESGPEATLAEIISIADQLVEQTNDTGAPLVGIGVGIPEPVEFSTGRPLSQRILPTWDRYPVREELTAHFGVDVWVDNDVTAMALGELRAGVARQAPNFIYVKVGTGIGAGLISNGRLHRGAQGAAGDIGHIIVDRKSAAICKCGKRGCLSAVASGYALARAATAAASDGSNAYLADALARRGKLTSTDVGAAANTGDVFCIDLLRRAGHQIGRVLAGAVSFFNPDLIVIGGGVARSGNLLLPAIRQAVYEDPLPLATNHLRIELSHLHQHSGVVGAAFTALDQLLIAGRLDHWPPRPGAGLRATEAN